MHRSTTKTLTTTVRRPWRGWLVLGLCLGWLGCESVPDLDKSTFACDGQARCGVGFHCDSQSDTCVPDGATCAVDDDCPPEALCGASGTCEALMEGLRCDDRIGSENADAVEFGFVMALSGAFKESGLDHRRVAEMAVAEINLNGGIEGPDGPREMAFRVCDNQSRVDFAVASTRYLARLGVPAILGPGFSSLFKPAAEQAGIEEGVFMLSPSATAPSISGLADNGLVWRISSSDLEQAFALAYFAVWLSKEADTSDLPVNIVAVATADTYGDGLVNGFELALPGAQALLDSASQPVPPVNFSKLAHLNIDDSADWSAEVSNLLGELESRNPDILLFIGYEPTADILAGMKLLPGLANVPTLLADGVYSDALATSYGSAEELPPVLFGVQPGMRSGAAYEQFVTRYQAHTSTVTAPPAWAEFTYDAVYLLALAAAAMGEDEMSGSKFAEVFGRFDAEGGKVIEAGPAHFVSASTEMAAGKGIDVRGASGPLDFDVTTGEPQTVGILRWTVDFPTPDSAATIQSCGLSMVQEPGLPEPAVYWCNALCTPPPTENLDCDLGFCEGQDTICAQGQCTGGVDCRPPSTL